LGLRPADFRTLARAVAGASALHRAGPNTRRSTMTKTTTAVGELRTVALSAIHVEEQFNPRDSVEQARVDELADSMRQHGPLVPLIVAPNGDQGYRLIAGERRLRAAAKAGVEEVPVIVRVTADDGESLELALVENIAREALNPVEEAVGFKRLMDERGLTRKGVAERLSIAQKRVTERLAILELPEELHRKVAVGEIPPGAIKALVALARIHPGLPAVALGAVGREVASDGWDEPPTWTEVADDPIGVVLAERNFEEAPFDDLYVASGLYPIERFSLSEKTTRELASYAQLAGIEPEQVVVRFDRTAVEAANGLNAYHATKSGYSGLIVRMLKAERAHQRQIKQSQREPAEQASSDPADRVVPSEEERKREQRQKDQEARRQASAYNHELGAACVKQLSRIRVDERVVKLLACIDLHGELDKIASRGARYGFPGWTTEVQLKNGRTKVEYHDPAGATEAARCYLAGAKTAADVAGRALALIAMARYATEQVVARSSQSHYDIVVRDAYGRGLPWSAEVLDIIDDICADRLPEELTKEVREERAQARERRALVTDAMACVQTLGSKERAKLVAKVESRLGDHAYQAWELHQRIHELEETEAKQSSDASSDEQEREAA
jgi:ParB/RepB/Spo0J family partition protein